MCHLILFLPLLALPALWLLPPDAAIGVVAIIAVLSGAMYALVLKAMRAPLTNGPQRLLHALATVRRIEGRSLSVWVQSELWSAETDDENVKLGDTVEVLAIKGLTLKVRETAAERAAAPSSRGTECVPH